jgi:hypothetical protein
LDIEGISEVIVVEMGSSFFFGGEYRCFVLFSFISGLFLCSLGKKSFGLLRVIELFFFCDS